MFRRPGFPGRGSTAPAEGGPGGRHGPHVIEPKYPGVVEQYVNLGVCYDREGLQAVREELQGCMRGYKEHYQRAYRCLGAAAEIREDVRDTLMTEELEAKLAKRARGILSRELKPRKTGEAGAVKQRFLGAVTHKGVLTLYGTASAQCTRIYELSDRYGLAHPLLARLLSGAVLGAMTWWPAPTPWLRSGWPTCWCPRRGWPSSPPLRPSPTRGGPAAACGWRLWRTRTCSADAGPGCASP